MPEEINGGKWYSGIPLREVLRYAGVSDETRCGEEILHNAVKAVNEVGECAAPRKIWRECTLHISGEQCEIDGLSVTSRDFAAHLQDSERAIVFAATLGSGVDMLIMRHSAVKMSYAVMLQAAAAALIELYCDIANEELEVRYAAEGLYLRPRFSPGYGDFSLTHLRGLTDHIQAYKYAGITVSGGGQMTPMKSVTAVIGLTRTRQGGATGSCASGKCTRCPNVQCVFRRV